MELMEFVENITLTQVAAFLVFVGGLYGGAKYLKKELKDGILVFLFRAISLLLEDDLAILEHLRTSNNTGKMAEQESKVQKFLIER